MTCRDWFQLALKEGFTVFREQQYVADHGWSVRRIEDVRLMRTRQFAEDAGPLAHPVRPESYLEIDNCYTDTVYSKGAEVVRMLATLVGERAFRRGTDDFFERHDGRAVAVEDFLDCVSGASGRDLTQFARWYDRAGTPLLKVTADFDAAAGVYEMQVEQMLSDGKSGAEALHIPLAVGLLDDEGRELPVHIEDDNGAGTGTRVLELRGRRQGFRFTDLKQRPVLALLRGFSAPVEVRFEYALEDLRVLALHDPDAYVRWDAVQRLAAKSVGGNDQRALTALQEVFAAVLEQHGDDPGLDAQLLELPDVVTLADGLDEPDLDGVHRRRQALIVQFAAGLREPFEAVYRRCRSDAAFRPLPADVGRRALRNTCLGYLAAPADRDAAQRCLSHYHDADNMTDALAALSLLADGDTPQRDEALADFRRHWSHEPLVMDKWLAVQARSARGDALERVRELMRDPLFSIDQPNRVRSLIEVFCAENPMGFHRADGSGYRFLADCVMDIDPGNPQLAAGLLRYLVNRRGCDPKRCRLMRRELERVATVPGLSPQSSELLASALREA